MAAELRALDADFASCCGEDGLDVAGEELLRGAAARVRVDEDFDAFLALGGAVGAVEEAREPLRGARAVGFLDEVLDAGGADEMFGGRGGLGVVDYDVVV